MVNMLQKFVPGIHLESCDCSIAHNQVCNIFVDNNDLPTMSRHRGVEDKIEIICHDCKKTA